MKTVTDSAARPSHTEGCRLSFTMEKAEDGLILRFFLKEKLSLSHRTLSALKRKENGILLNGCPVTVRAVLREGDILSLSLSDEEGAKNGAISPAALPLDILYEDEHLCVCNKPAGMPTHPSFRHRSDTLANALAYRYLGAPFVFRAVNRLDKDTSGIVLTAKTAFAAAALAEALQSGSVKKEYLAVVSGVTEKEGEVRRPIRRKEGSIILREVCDEGGEDAHTLYRRLYTDGEHSLLLVRTLTGRTHQIRVHMASLGHPLSGDSLYGGDEAFPRTALHAYKLSFPHPVSKEILTVTAPLPSDFSHVSSFL